MLLYVVRKDDIVSANCVDLRPMIRNVANGPAPLIAMVNALLNSKTLCLQGFRAGGL